MDDLLEQVLACFREEVSGVEFRRGSASGWGTRLLTAPVVSGEVLSQRQEGNSRETVLQFSLFSMEQEQGEELLSTLDSDEEIEEVYNLFMERFFQEEEE